MVSIAISTFSGSMLPSVIAILLASNTAGMWFSVAICAGILLAVAGAAGLEAGSGKG